jgi:hypothetical protein
MTWKSTDGTRRRWKYALDSVIVYRHVYSGPLNPSVQNCPGSHGKHILVIHGAEDQNVPIAGGQGTKGVSRVAYKSEQYTQQIFNASGADFHLQTVQGADHILDNIDVRIEQTERISIAGKAARFFGLAKESR